MKRSARICIMLLFAWGAGVLYFFQKVALLHPLFSLLLSLAWLIIFTLSAFGWGALTWSLLAGEDSLRGMALLLAPALGLIPLMAGAAGLASASALSYFPLLLILGAGLAAGVYYLRRHPLNWRWRNSPFLPLTVLICLALWTLMIASVLSGFYDQFHYHLAFPFQWLRHGTMIAFSRNAYSYFPANMGLLYTYGLSTFGAPAAQLIHWWMGAYSVLLIGTAAAKIAGRVSGWWAAACFAVTPAVILSSTWAAADLGVVLAAVSGWLFLTLAWKMRKIEGRKWPVWLFSGSMAGIAAGCKLLALATVAIPLFLGVLLFSPDEGESRIRRSLLWFSGAVMVFLPWLIRNAILTGNPFYPFLCRFFHWGELSRQMAANPSYANGIAKVSTSLPDLGRMATLSTFHPFNDAAGHIGLLFLTLLPLIIWIIWKCKKTMLRRLAVVTAVAFIGWGSGPLLARYELPFLAFLSIPLGIAWHALIKSGCIRKVWIPVTLMAALFLINFFNGNSSVELSRLSSLLERENIRIVVEKNVSYWGIVPMVNERLPGNARILLAGEARCYGIERSVVVEDPFHEPFLKELADSSVSVEEMVRKLKGQGITHILFNHQDAKRQAVMTGKASYLVFNTSAAQTRFKNFWEGHLQQLFESGPVEVLQVR